MTAPDADTIWSITDPPFSPEEYGQRLVKVRAEMADHGLDVLVVTDPSNMAWLTGYDGWSFYTHQAVVVALDAGPVWWGRAIDVNGARRTTSLPHDAIVGYPEELVQASEQHPHSHLAGVLADLGHGTARIGAELDTHYYSAAAHHHLTDGLPHVLFADATGLVNRQRGIKSPQELVYLRRAARIVERLHALVRDRVEPGLRKSALVAEILAAGIDGVPGIGDAAGHGGDYPAIVPLLPSGEDAAAPHLTWDDRPFTAGTGTFFELAGCYRRYHAPMSRSVFLGTPPEAMRRAEDALLAGLEAGLEAARAGNRACDVAAALYGCLERAGIEREGRCGYPIGLAYPPDWGERTISLRTSDTSVLEPGMTFHFMPALWLQDWGLQMTESILIRPEGPAECLADVPRELFVRA